MPSGWHIHPHSYVTWMRFLIYTTRGGSSAFAQRPLPPPHPTPPHSLSTVVSVALADTWTQGLIYKAGYILNAINTKDPIVNGHMQHCCMKLLNKMAHFRLPPIVNCHTPMHIILVVHACVWACVRVWDRMNGPLTRYVKMWVAHVPGMSGTFSPPPTSKETASSRSRHASRHVRDARAVIHVGIAYPRWQGKRSRQSRRMRTRNFTYLARRAYRFSSGMTRLWASRALREEHNRWYWLSGPEVRGDMWAPGQPDGGSSTRVVIWDYIIGDQRPWRVYRCLCEHGKVYCMD